MSIRARNVAATAYRWSHLIGVAMLFALLSTTSAPVSSGERLRTLIDDARPLLRMHGRMERVDDASNTLEDATALTLRSFAGFHTGEVAGVSFRVAVENVAHLVDDFNVPGESSKGYDVVADPKGTELEQAFVEYARVPATTVRVGRQYLTYRPAPLHRFIGTVPWRQNWQSMDAIAIENRSIDGLRVNYAFVSRVNRIFGKDNPDRALARSPMSSHLVNLQYSGLTPGTLEAYYYRLDYDRDDLSAPFSDRETIGAKLAGSREVGDVLKARYLLEVSHQRAIEDNATSFEAARQYRLELGLEKAPSAPAESMSARVGYEVLESDNGVSFSTPLATVHAFQGWADRFIGFPSAGVRNAYLKGSVTFDGALTVTCALHNFRADDGGFTYGNEIDVQLTKKIGRFTLSLKHASYSGHDATAAGAVGVDKTVSWAFIDYAL